MSNAYEAVRSQENADCRYAVGDAVYVKPAQTRCTTRWIEGVATGVSSDTNIEVDGTPRHVADCRTVSVSGCLVRNKDLLIIKSPLCVVLNVQKSCLFTCTIVL